MVKEEKIKAVEDLKNKIEQYPIIGLLDMYKMPSRQMQEIKKQLRDKATIIVTKKMILKFAIENSNRPNIQELEKIIPQQSGLVFTQLEPFKFYSVVSKLKSPTTAKEGDVAPYDILVSAGPTNLMPGPVISEFAKVKIPAGVEEGKIAIKKDTVAARKGDVISKALAGILQKLGIEPMEVGLNVVAIYDNGMIYGKEALSLVGEPFLNKIKGAFNQALNLSIAICYPTKDNIKYLIAKAFNGAKAIENKFGGVK